MRAQSFQMGGGALLAASRDFFNEPHFGHAQAVSYIEPQWLPVAFTASWWTASTFGWPERLKRRAEHHRTRETFWRLQTEPTVGSESSTA
jgi:hypothetical protein